jgi:solute carrier family 45 protein 1/2/4
MGLSFGVTQFAPFAMIGLECASTVSLSAPVLPPTATELESEGRQDEEDMEGKRQREVEAGTIMGLHNVAISAPQLVAAGVCAIVFSLCKGLGSGMGIAWGLRVSVVPAVVAAWQSRKLVKAYEDA